MASLLPLKRIHLAECSSTNMVAQEMLQKGEDIANTIISTDFQKDGKGIDTNKWQSEAGKNLLFSLVVKPEKLHAAEQFKLTKAVSLAVQQSLLEILPWENISVKWPNDIYVDDRKICGMLISNTIMGSQIGWSIIGIGLNVNQSAFPPDLPNPLSVKQLAGMNTNRDWLLDKLSIAIANKIAQLLENPNDKNLDDAYLKALYRIKGWHQYESEDQLFTAKIMDVNPYGHLILEGQSGERKSYELKEVRFI